MKKIFSALLIALTINCSAQTGKKDSTLVHGFMDFNGYYDTREFSVLTVNLMANFPKRVQYFSLTNIKGVQQTSDIGTLYSEQNIRWAITKKAPVDITSQYVIRNGNSNDDLRLGIRWKLSSTSFLKSTFKKLNMFFSINPTLVQLSATNDPKGFTQIEYVYNIKIWPSKFKNRVYIGGFADQNIVYNSNNEMSSINWVTEHQLGINIIDRLYIVAEFRLNEYLPETTGLGYGLEYKITF